MLTRTITHTDTHIFSLSLLFSLLFSSLLFSSLLFSSLCRMARAIATVLQFSPEEEEKALQACETAQTATGSWLW